MATYAPQEKQYYDQLFNIVDKDGTEVLPGQDVLPFLMSSKLPQQTLGEIWALSDPENNGFLTKDGWYRAARLIGWMQKGGQTKVDESLVSRSGPYPTFSGQPPPPAQPPLSAQNTGRSPAAANSLPPLNPADRTKFTRIFVGCNPQNGQVSGDKARDIFVKSQLDYEKLGQIWNLADTQKRGSLDLPDFIIGMYFIQSAMANPSLQLPSTLPPGLYEQASGGRPAPISPLAQQNTGPTASPVRAQYTGGVMQPQLTGNSAAGTPPRAPPSRQFSAQPAFNPRGAFGVAAAPWDVTAQAKATSDGFFTQLDPQNRGFVEGDVAVPFMVQSQLDEGTLASIWDLADIRQQGHLDRDEFAVAMHLINAKLAGQDVPQSLPQSLIPPSLRGQQPAQVPAPGQSSTAKDLFDLNFDDEPPKSNVAPPPNFPQPSQPAPARAAAAPFASAFLPQPPSRQATAEPTSRTISPAPQQAQTSVFGVSPFQRGLQRQTSDLLGDDSAEPAPEVPDRSADLGNTQNQLDNTTRSLDTVSKDREGLETKAKSTAVQLEELEAKLSEVRVRHETETKAVADLRLRVGEQETKLHQLQAEVIGAESDLSAMKSEKDELGQALLRDKEEVRGLQKRMKEVDDEKATLKGLLEKMKKEARQQKGLVSIAKKQLSTAEGSRDGAQGELDEFSANRGREEEEEHSSVGTAAGAAAAGAGLAGVAGLAVHELEKGKSKESERADSFTSNNASPAVSVPLPETPRAMSPNPTGASNRSNNPFDRLGKPAIRSPPPPPPGAASPPASAAPTPPATAGEQAPVQEEDGLGTKALLGAGAAVGVVAGVAAAGAETLYNAAKEAVSPEQHDQGSKEVATEPVASQAPAETDAFGASNTAEDEKTPVATHQALLDTDPFGAPASAGPQQSSFDNAFDSAFDDSFGTSPQTSGAPAASGLTTSAPTDFDSAFADFDKDETPAPSADPAVNEVQEKDNASTLQGGLPSGIPASAIPDGLRPNNERTLSTQALAPESVPDTPMTDAAGSIAHSREESPAPLSRAPAPISRTLATAHSEGGGSSDEDEGPEDLEAPKRVYSPRPDEDREDLEDDAPLGSSTAAPVAPASTYPLAPPALSAPVSQTGSTKSPSMEEPMPKTRRSAPPPPARAAAPAVDDFDPFAGGAASLARQPEPVSALPEAVATQQTAAAGPKTAGFDEDDDFDFSDLPPATVEQASTAPAATSAPAKGSAFDDEFANFDDDFTETGQGSQINSGSSGSMSKSYEMVSPTQAGGPSAAHGQSQGPVSSQGPGSHYDEWGFGGGDSNTAQAKAAAPTSTATAPVSFDDAFGEDFEPAPPAQQEHYAAPSGPPPSKQGQSLKPPTIERNDSVAQADDLEDVKKLCAMGFSRTLAIGALEANDYNFQKALNVLISQ